MSKLPRDILIGFDFYGSGNVGDDLMLGGFLQALADIEGGAGIRLHGLSAWPLGSQRRRFPEIHWISRRGKKKPLDPGTIECWAGVGGTPFQATDGSWFLDRLRADAELIRRFPRKVLVNVGAETEAAAQSAEWAGVAGVFDRISTRDQMGRDFLKSLGLPAGHLRVGADLAHVSLARLADVIVAEQDFSLGVVFTSDTFNEEDVSELGQFLLAATGPVAFIANEVRAGKNFERGVHDRLVKIYGREMQERAVLLVPDYADATLAGLVHPIARCQTILSTRYHAALTAAWLGCRVGVMARSSKVRAAADALRVPFMSGTVTVEKLKQLQADAQSVARSRLAALVEEARAGVAFSLGG